MKSLSLSALLSAVHSQARRAAVWLPWLGVALLLAAVLSPGAVVASRLAFQSPESPPPEPTATETPLPTEAPPTATQVPPTATQPARAPTTTQVPAQPTQPAPTPVPKATNTAPAQGTAPAQATAPAQKTPPAQATAPAQATPAATGSPSPTAKATQTPAPSPTARRVPTPTPAPEGEASINWVKFWDTLVVWLAYPWICCGVGLLLLVPVILLYLEISGRRRPPLPPEIPPEPVGGEFAPDEELNE